MLRRRFDSFFGTILLAAVVPLVFFSTICSRIGFARAGKKALHPGRSPQPSSSATPAADEFQFHRSVEAYEDLIDSVIEEERA